MNTLTAPIFLNPNSDKSIKEVKNLNTFSKVFREDAFCKKFVAKEGFELNYIDFKWEYIINFNNRSGFMVLNEFGKDLRFFVYKTEDDLNWNEFLIKDFNRNDNKTMMRLITLIKQQYRNIK